VAHGYGDATWGIVGAALAADDHVRVGLEDARMLADGREIRSNGDLVENAVRIAEALGRTPIGPAAVAALLAPVAEAAPR
jgi:3-keto-5-aminohexanoate cleavage enzyme